MIAIVIGVWALGSIFLGLLLGSLFKVFAKRRPLEEDLFAWLAETPSPSQTSPALGAGGQRDCEVFLQPF